MKIVINTDYGGFGISDQAFKQYLELKDIEYTTKEAESTFVGTEFYDKAGNYINCYDITRDDSVLCQVVETLGKAAWGDFSCLKVVEIPDEVEWYIQEYDGIESIHEVHRQWN
jgi:hypothetical protein